MCIYTVQNYIYIYMIEREKTVEKEDRSSIPGLWSKDF